MAAKRKTAKKKPAQRKRAKPAARKRAPKKASAKKAASKRAPRKPAKKATPTGKFDFAIIEHPFSPGTKVGVWNLGDIGTEQRESREPVKAAVGSATVGKDGSMTVEAPPGPYLLGAKTDERVTKIDNKNVKEDVWKFVGFTIRKGR